MTKILNKLRTGIEGFDDISHGGIPRARTTLIFGKPGTGKTVFGMQMLIEGVEKYSEPGIFVAFEESSHQVIQNMSTFGWDFTRIPGDRLFFLNARVSADVLRAGAIDLHALLAGLSAKAKEIGAKRIVFDSVDALLSIIDDREAERREIYRLHDWLAESGLTGLITVREETARAFTPRFDFLEYMADCVLRLESHLIGRVVMRSLRILKYRGSAYEQNSFPFVIADKGIEVASFGTLADVEYPASEERVSSGIDRLDAMLEGGFYRGSSILITGAPGTAKTTLTGAYLKRAAQRQERTLFVGFDESWTEIIRNLKTIGIDLTPIIASGQLKMYTSRSDARSAEQHLLVIRSLINEHKAQCLVVDPLSAIVKGSGAQMAFSVAERLVHLCKGQGITLICTSVLGELMQDFEGTPIRVSTIADTWIHLTYISKGGERNRALSVIKARGTAHSSQVRELLIGRNGPTLADVYTAGGEVLMGTLRMEKETERLLERNKQRTEVELKQRDLEHSEADIESHILKLQRELEAKRIELELLHKEAQIREQAWQQQEYKSRKLRGGANEQSSDRRSREE